MAQLLVTPTLVAKEALAILKDNIAYPFLVHTDYEKDFYEGSGVTVNVRKPAVLEGKDFASQVSDQEITEATIPVKLDRHADVSVQLTSKELTLDLEDFSKQIIAPAMAALAEKINREIAAEALANAGKYEVGTAAPSDLKDISKLAKALDVKKAPVADRKLVFGVSDKWKYAVVENLSFVNAAGSNAVLREGAIDRIYGLDAFWSQGNVNAEGATKGTQNSISVASGSTAGQVDLSAGTGTNTFKKGEGFVYEGKVYKFTADVTLTSGSASAVAVAPAFPASVSATPVVVLQNDTTVAFHKNAIAFVNRPLSVPLGAPNAASASADGISVRIVYDYDSSTKKDRISFDLIYGIKVLNKDHIAALI